MNVEAKYARADLLVSIEGLNAEQAANWLRTQIEWEGNDTNGKTVEHSQAASLKMPHVSL